MSSIAAVYPTQAAIVAMPRTEVDSETPSASLRLMMRYGMGSMVAALATASAQPRIAVIIPHTVRGKNGLPIDVRVQQRALSERYRWSVIGSGTLAAIRERDLRSCATLAAGRTGAFVGLGETGLGDRLGRTR